MSSPGLLAWQLIHAQVGLARLVRGTWVGAWPSVMGHHRSSALKWDDVMDPPAGQSPSAHVWESFMMRMAYFSGTSLWVTNVANRQRAYIYSNIPCNLQVFFVAIC